jgi:hypothetical protein
MHVLNIHIIKLIYISKFLEILFKLKYNIYMHKKIHHTCNHSCTQKTFTCTLLFNESLFYF